MYVNFNFFLGQSMHSTKAIDLIFGRNQDFVILNHPAKFHFSCVLFEILDIKTHKQTPMKIIPPQKQIFGEVNSQCDFKLLFKSNMHLFNSN